MEGLVEVVRRGAREGGGGVSVGVGRFEVDEGALGGGIWGKSRGR